MSNEEQVTFLYFTKLKGLYTQSSFSLWLFFWVYLIFSLRRRENR
jgi:hypothetical protein